MNFNIFVNVVLLIVAAGHINGQDAIAEAAPEPIFTILPFPLPATKYPIKQDCSLVKCRLPTCTGDMKPIKLAGACCPQCVLDCTDILCLDCVGTREFDQCCPTCDIGGPVAEAY